MLAIAARAMAVNVQANVFIARLLHGVMVPALRGSSRPPTWMYEGEALADLLGGVELGGACISDT
jgi:hypothetical protein